MGYAYTDPMSLDGSSGVVSLNQLECLGIQVSPVLYNQISFRQSRPKHHVKRGSG